MKVPFSNEKREKKATCTTNTSVNTEKAKNKQNLQRHLNSFKSYNKGTQSKKNKDMRGLRE